MEVQLLYFLVGLGLTNVRSSEYVLYCLLELKGWLCGHQVDGLPTYLCLSQLNSFAAFGHLSIAVLQHL